MRFRLAPWGVMTALAALAPATGVRAQDQDPATWSRVVARGALDLCRADAPDAAAVVDHGQIWGWPRFTGYLEHPDGYQRQAGGESRRELVAGDKTTYVEMTVQDGQVVSAAPATIRYFRCNVTANAAVEADLEAYFTALYGAPASKTDKAVVWLAGVAKDAAPDDDAAAIKPLAAAPAGAQALRIELTHELGVDSAKFAIYRKASPE